MRLHQEDFCQALGIMSDNKYQNDGGPGVADIINLIREKSSMPIVDIQRAIELLIFQLFIGNCDAHGKNYSLVFDEGIRLAPAYDIVSTVVYPPLTRRLSMKFGSYYELERLSLSHLQETFAKCNIKANTVNKVIEQIKGKIELVDKFIHEDDIAKQNPELLKLILDWMKKVSELMFCK